MPYTARIIKYYDSAAFAWRVVYSQPRNKTGKQKDCQSTFLHGEGKMQVSCNKFIYGLSSTSGKTHSEKACAEDFEVTIMRLTGLSFHREKRRALAYTGHLF